MTVTKTVPALKDYLWGGERLKEYHKKSEGKIAESWEFSLHPDGYCKICSGQTLYSVLAQENFEPLGPIAIKDTPIIKFLNAEQPLSVQVHPAPEKGGKNELWIILEAEEDSYILLDGDFSDGETETLCQSGEILKRMKKIRVRKGEEYFIPAGTVHALGKGITALEIQQFSNLTYRLYDYHRTDGRGNLRPLHIREGAECIAQKNTTPPKSFFQVEKIKIDGKTIFAPRKTFFTLTVLQGQGQVEKIPAQKGDTFFVPCRTPLLVEGRLETVAVYP